LETWSGVIVIEIRENNKAMTLPFGSNRKKKLVVVRWAAV
jgi:hypothetical protein